MVQVEPTRGGPGPEAFQTGLGFSNWVGRDGEGKKKEKLSLLPSFPDFRTGLPVLDKLISAPGFFLPKPLASAAHQEAFSPAPALHTPALLPGRKPPINQEGWGSFLVTYHTHSTGLTACRRSGGQEGLLQMV